MHVLLLMLQDIHSNHSSSDIRARQFGRKTEKYFVEKTGPTSYACKTSLILKENQTRSGIGKEFRYSVSVKFRIVRPEINICR